MMKNTVYCLRCIPGMPHCYADITGGIWTHRKYRRGSKRQFKKLNAVKNLAGYSNVRLIRKQYLVHRLILLTFRGEPESDQITRHLDGDPSNNRLDNLAWGTHAENTADMIRHGTYKGGPYNTKAEVTEELVRRVWELHNQWYPIRRIAERLNLSNKTVHGIINRLTFTYWMPAGVEDWDRTQTRDSRALPPPQEKEEEGIDPIFGTDLPL